MKLSTSIMFMVLVKYLTLTCRAVIGIFETQFKKGLPLTVVRPGSQKGILHI